MAFRKYIDSKYMFYSEQSYEIIALIEKEKKDNTLSVNGLFSESLDLEKFTSVFG